MFDIFFAPTFFVQLTQPAVGNSSRNLDLFFDLIIMLLVLCIVITKHYINDTAVIICNYHVQGLHSWQLSFLWLLPVSHVVNKLDIWTYEQHLSLFLTQHLRVAYNKAGTHSRFHSFLWWRRHLAIQQVRYDGMFPDVGGLVFDLCHDVELGPLSSNFTGLLEVSSLKCPNFTN